MKRVINTDSAELDLTKVYEQGGPRAFKPNGLWYSIDGEWEDWCRDNMDHWIKKHNIELVIDESRMLILKTLPQVDRFRESFESVSDYSHLIKEVDWEKVRQVYAGIEIQNYHKLKGWGFNPMFDSMWFYGWDVSSGCIWDLSIIKKVTVWGK